MPYTSTHTGQQLDALVDGAIQAISLLNLIYPVGSIYMSVNNVSPSTFIGGTWQAIEGKFLIGADSTYTSGSNGGSDKHTHTYAHTHEYAHTHTTPATTTDSHTLTVAEMPSHMHGVYMKNWAGDLGVAIVPSSTTDSDGSWYGIKDTPEGAHHTGSPADSGSSLYARSTGGGGGHTHGQKATTTNSQSTSTTNSQSTSTTSEVSNLPPYFAVYMW